MESFYTKLAKKLLEDLSTNKEMAVKQLAYFLRGFHIGIMVLQKKENE